jgi:hypothetical protein
MQRYNMPMQLSNRAHEVKVWEAETFSKCNNSEQLITLIQPQKTVLEVKGCSLDYHPTEHVACCGHQVITCIHVCGGRYGALMTHSQVLWRHEAHMLVEVLDMIADASGLLCELPFISCSTALSWQQLRRCLPSPMQLMFSW